MINRLSTNYSWLNKLIPEGMPIPSSTIISGPGGSGKPLVATAFLAAWLQQGGSSLIFLLNSDRTYVEHIFSLYDIDPEVYQSKIYFIDFNPRLSLIEESESNLIRANILDPDVLLECIETGSRKLNVPESEILLYGAALNILFFSPTWGEKIFIAWKDIISGSDTYSSLFSVSTSAFKKKIAQLEEVADNLMYSRIEKPMKLMFRIARLKGVPFLSEETQVPLSEEVLRNLKNESGKLRKQIIPIVSSL